MTILCEMGVVSSQLLLQEGRSIPAKQFTIYYRNIVWPSYFPRDLALRAVLCGKSIRVKQITATRIQEDQSIQPRRGLINRRRP